MKNLYKITKTHYHSSLKFVLLIISLGLSVSESYAQHVLPVFSGDWYTKATRESTDACFNKHYSYTNRFHLSGQEIARQLLNKVTPHSDCTWGDVFIAYTSPDFIPTDFVGGGDDWTQLTKDHLNPVNTTWERVCKDKDGYHKDSVEVELKPSYLCPTGSRQSTDRKDHREGCSTEPRACAADMAGRGMDSKILGDAGHVALTDDTSPGIIDSVVLEVLKDPTPGIFYHTLESFKHYKDTVYWGEKFDSSANLDISTARSIIQTGSEQQYFNFEYAYSWDFHPGSSYLNIVYDQNTHEWTTIFTSTTAKFRCDSFVYYSYLAGANIHIVPDFKAPISPRSLFTSFLSFRDPSGISLGLNTLLTDNSSIQKLETELANKLTTSELLDSSSYHYVNDPSISSEEKIKNLWMLTKQYRKDDNKFNYLLDCLSTLTPIQLVSEFIDEYHSQANVKNKIKLLYTLNRLLNDNSKATQLLIKNHVDKVISIQKLFQEVLRTESDKQILRVAIQLYPTIVPANQAVIDLQTALSRPQIKSIQSIFTPDEVIKNQLWFAFETKEQQITKIPALINQERTGIEKQLLASNVCAIIELIPSEAINNQIQKLLADYLLNNQSNLLTNDVATSACRWLNAYGKIMAPTNTNNFIINYIHKQTNNLLQAKLISQLDKKQVSLISKNDISYYRNKFKLCIKNKNLNSLDKLIYKKAMSVLYFGSNCISGPKVS